MEDHKNAIPILRKSLKYRQQANSINNEKQTRLLVAILDLNNKEITIRGEEAEIRATNLQNKFLKLTLSLAILVIIIIVFVYIVLHMKENFKSKFCKRICDKNTTSSLVKLSVYKHILFALFFPAETDPSSKYQIANACGDIFMSLGIIFLLSGYHLLYSCLN